VSTRTLARSTINRVVRGGKRGNGRFTRTAPAGIYGRTAQFPHDMNHRRRDAPVSLRYEGPRRARRRVPSTSFLTSAPTRATNPKLAREEPIAVQLSRSVLPLAATVEFRENARIALASRYRKLSDYEICAHREASRSVGISIARVARREKR